MSGLTTLGADTAFPKVNHIGFTFENVKRNAFLEKLGRNENGHAGGSSNSVDTGVIYSNLPKAHKTGTTIVGVKFANGVVLGADTRATSELVVDKNCEKIHYIAPNIYCCGAGTAADTEATTDQISSQLHLLRLNSGEESRVITAMTKLKRHLFNYQGHVSAALVLGGVDSTGPGLFTVYPHGSTDKLPFVTMGSGSLAAMAIMESQYKEGLTREEAKQLVIDAIRAGIYNDLGSGSNVDYTIIERVGDETKVERERNYGKTSEENDVARLRSAIAVPKYKEFPEGTTLVVEEETYTETF